MRRLLYLAALSVLAVVVLAPAGGAQNRFNCPDFTYQEDAQAVLNADPSDPNRLDADKNGVACQDLPHRPTAQQPAQQQPATPQPPPQQEATTPQPAPQPQAEATSPPLLEAGGNLPATGGVSLVLISTGALLLGSGVLAFAVLRRRG